MKIIKIFLFITLLLANGQAYSTYPSTELDFLTLPPYCKARKFGHEGEPEYDRWRKKFGPDFIHMHHYCGGLHSINLSFKELDKAKYKHILEIAIKEMRTVQHEFSANFIMQPKIQYDLGQIYEKLGEDGFALRAYQESIKLNPKNAPPYKAISDLYKKQSKTKT